METLKGSNGIQENYNKVLVVSSDPELITSEALDAEVDTIIEAIAASNGIDSVVEVISTLHQGELIEKLREFRPDIVHFANRGSGQSYVRMFSSGGLVRNVAGPTIANLLLQADCNPRLVIFANCSVFREEFSLLASTNFIVSIKSQYPTFSIPLTVIKMLYTAMADFRYYGIAISRIVEKFIQDQIEKQIELRIRATEIPKEINSEARKLFYLGNSSVSLDEEARIGDHVSSIQMEDAGHADRSLVPQVPALTGSMDSAPKQEPKKSGSSRRLYRVWYGTNRKPLSSSKNGHYGVERDELVHYGYCDVVIPKHHKIGEVREHWLKRLLWTGESNTLRIESRAYLSSVSLFGKMRKYFESLPKDENNLLFYLHGYSVSFDSAAIRAAQLGVDLGVQGTTAFFSWPSLGTFKGYPADEATIEASEQAISNFLVNICEESGAERIHIIAHSMGNRGLLRALSSMINSVRQKVGKKVDQVFLAAPDVDAQVFKNLAKAYRDACNRATMYVSNKDIALWGSKYFHAYQRAGYSPPVTVVPEIDTVQVPKLNLDLFGHGYVSEAKEVLTDIHALITSNTDPKSRFGLEYRETSLGDEYWQIKH